MTVEFSHGLYTTAVREGRASRAKRMNKPSTIAEKLAIYRCDITAPAGRAQQTHSPSGRRHWRNGVRAGLGPAAAGPQRRLSAPAIQDGGRYGAMVARAVRGTAITDRPFQAFFNRSRDATSNRHDGARSIHIRKRAPIEKYRPRTSKSTDDAACGEIRELVVIGGSRSKRFSILPNSATFGVI
jgi:hypothetical protein